MSCRIAAYLLGGLVLTVGMSCSRRAGSQGERLAILRFENLGGDSAHDWMGRALSEIVAADLAGVPGVTVIAPAKLQGFERLLGRQLSAAPGISAERTQAVLAGANRLVYGQYQVRGGKLEIEITVEDPSVNRTVRLLEAGGGAGDVIAAAGEAARQIHPGARPYITRSQAAVRGWIAGMEEEPARAPGALAAAIAADPGFAPPYFMLAQLNLARQDRAGAERILTQAMAHAEAMPAADRARVELESALLRGDVAARRRALAALAQATPGDPALWRAMAEDASSRRQYREAVESLKKAAALAPADGTVLNSLGYAFAFAGDLQSARQALEQYGTLHPTEANPLDSLGDVHLRLGRFKEAEGYYTQAHQRDAAFLGGGTLLKAAWARLLTGDVPGADVIARRYLDARKQANDAVVEYREAQWLWISGRRPQGFARLSAFCRANHSGPLIDYASRGYAQLALWNLALGARPAALEMAGQAMSLARPATAAIAVMARFLAQPQASAAEWTARAGKSFPQPQQAGFKNLTLAYALLLAREYSAAAPLLREMYQSPAQGPDDTLPVLVAWAELESGNAEAAAPLLDPNPLPSADGQTPFAMMSFPRQFYLRGLLAEKQQKRDASVAAYRTFLQLSGETPLQWGEENHAREYVK